MKRNFNRNMQKMQNEFILRMQNKDDSNYSIAWSIKNTKLKNYPVLIYSEVGKYFAYVDADEICISDFISCEILYDKVIKNFNILESEKPCLAKCMYDFSVKDLYTLDKERLQTTVDEYYNTWMKAQEEIATAMQTLQG